MNSMSMTSDTSVHMPIPRPHLTEARRNHGWSQKDLALRIGTTPLTISRWERGITRPSARKCELLCKLFDLSAFALDLDTSTMDPAFASSSSFQAAEFMLEEDTVRRLAFLSDSGWFAARRGKYAEAQAFLLDGMALAQEMEDKKHLVDLLQILGFVAYAQQEHSQAEAYFQEAVSYARQHAEETRISLMLLNLGEVAIAQAKFTQAEYFLAEGLVFARQVNEHKERQRLTGILLAHLGLTARMLGNYSQAEAYFQEARAQTSECGNTQLTAMILYERGNLLLTMQDTHAAEVSFREMLLILSERDIEWLACSRYGLARVAAARSETTLAMRLGEECLATMAQLKSRRAGEIRTWLEALYNSISPVFTDREHAMLKLLAQGDSNATIAQKVGLKHSTANSYLSMLYTKLHVSSRAKAVERARQMGGDAPG